MNTRTLEISEASETPTLSRTEFRYTNDGCGLIIERVTATGEITVWTITDPKDVLAISGFTSHVHGLMSKNNRPSYPDFHVMGGGR